MEDFREIIIWNKAIDKTISLAKNKVGHLKEGQELIYDMFLIKKKTARDKVLDELALETQRLNLYDLEPGV